MFCRHCGNQVVEHSKFCGVCGADLQSGIQQVQNTPTAYTVKHPPKKGSKFKSGVMLLMGVLLILLAVGQLAVTFIGQDAVAYVTRYEQKLIINNDDSTRNPSRYQLDYQFSVEGKRYTGSVTRVFSGGTHMRQTLSIKYLSFWPSVNAESGWKSNVAGPVMGVVGLLILIMGVKELLR